MILQCKNCDKEYEAKRASSKYCSKKCKLAYLRNNVSDSNDTLTNENDTQVLSVSNDDIKTIYTPTDRLFQDDAIKRDLGDNWLVFSEIVRAPKCRVCSKSFKTRLALLNYCSPVCRRKDLSS